MSEVTLILKRLPCYLDAESVVSNQGVVRLTQVSFLPPFTS